MARTRYLKPDFFKDEDIAELKHWERLLFAGLWILADKAGRLQDRPKWIKAELFPYEEVKIEDGLNNLAKHKKYGCLPFIQRYTENQQNYIQILKWTTHQKPHHQEPESLFPKPTTTLTKTITSTITIREHLQDLRTPSDNLRKKTKYLEFVMLYEEEYAKLLDKLGKDLTDELINNLNNYIGSKGKKYKSHYHTLLSWSQKETKNNNDKHQGAKDWLQSDKQST